MILQFCGQLRQLQPAVLASGVSLSSLFPSLSLPPFLLLLSLLFWSLLLSLPGDFSPLLPLLLPELFLQFSTSQDEAICKAQSTERGC